MQIPFTTFILLIALLSRTIGEQLPNVLQNPLLELDKVLKPPVLKHPTVIGTVIREAATTLENLVTCVINGPLGSPGPPLDPDLGAFPQTLEYCNPVPSCYRGLKCCAAKTPDKILYKLTLWKPGGKNGHDLKWRDQSEMSKLADCLRIVYLIHGYIVNYDSAPWMKDAKDIFVDKFIDCVLIVDWRGGNQLSYFDAVANVRVVGALIGFTIINWDIAPRTVLVGHSLGAQIVGEAGKFYSNRTGLLLPTCHGLDPAGPGYDGCSQSVRLNQDSCVDVQIVHTNAQTLDLLPIVTGLGTDRKSGKCDYWINGGFNQKHCEIVTFEEFLNVTTTFVKTLTVKPTIDLIVDKFFCSHARATRLYIDQLNNTCDFRGINCELCGLFNPIIPRPPNSDEETVPMIFGTECTTPKNYYVETTDKEPFC